jgi:hypothetical protein
MKLVYISLISLLIGSCTFKQSHKYEIYDCVGNKYHTNKLQFDDDGCVKGWMIDGDKEKEFLICGSYTIVSVD